MVVRLTRQTLWLPGRLRAVLVGLAVCGGAAGCRTGQDEVVVPVTPVHAMRQEPALTAEDEAGAKNVTADELYTVYSQDLIIGANPHQRFLNQVLRVRGVFNGVNRSLAPKVYLELRTHDREGFTYAALSPEAAPLLASLEPGVSVQLVCRGDGVIAGSPLLRNCRSAVPVAGR